MKMAPQKESEKKIISEKVAKVREVVDNVNTNDIILVLHSFDLDVNKTIQAFCEDGAASILGGWVTSSGESVTAAKKKKNKKAKSSQNSVASHTPVVAVTPSTAAPLQDTKSCAQTNVPTRQESTPVNKPTNKVVAKAEVNGAPAASVLADPLSIAFKEIRTSINNREKELRKIISENPKTSLSFDTASLIKLISSFGETGRPITNGKPNEKATKTVLQNNSAAPNSAQIKHATSQSSITSSLGADSGVNLSPTHKEDKKVTAPVKPATTVVSNGGLQMTSNSLSAAQLSALQETLKLSLAARGLDASVLTSSENINRRPRNNKQEGKKNGKNQKESQPKLSIL